MSTVSWKVAALAIGLSAAPAAARGQITVGRTIVEHEVAPGARYRGTVPITNGGAAPRRVRIYATDFGFDAEGGWRFAPPGTSARSSAGWTTLGTSELVIPAGRTVSVEYTVAVPAPRGAALEGSYWNAVMIEEVPGPADDAAGAMRGRAAVGVRQVMRTAMVLVTHIARTGSTELAFESPRIVGAPGRRVLQVDVRNAGTRAVRPRLTGEMFDDAGRSLGKRAGTERMLYPGTSARYRFELGAIPPGRYTAVVLGDAGGDAVFGAQYGVGF